MFRIFAISLFALAVVSTVSALVIPRGYKQDSDILEDYNVYHWRYLHLDCESQHGTPFFQQCCHPRLKSQEKEPLPQSCIPPTSLDEDCDDDGNPHVPATLPSSSEIPSSSSTPTHTTPFPDNHADTSPAVVTTPTPSHTNPPSNVHKQIEVNPAPTTTTQSPSPSPSPASAAKSQVFTGVATYYYQKGVAGACGTVHSDNDLICALVHCGQQLRITAIDGKSVVVTVADECPTCGSPTDIDLSEAAFKMLAPLPQGVVNMHWEFL
ncbi:RlpA-like double-psi beta-barrel-protein domain-containing protein-containing protein [Lactifluus volemus]|nr:RlpA-like double-psi beta-barrel-protein domain-containing protein-containing protein [Lactifluus volemus]